MLAVMAPSRSEPLAYIQGLRGIAAAAVVLYHARIFIDGPSFLDAGTRLFGSGSAGVDLFFVISGFIMMHTTGDVEGSPGAALGFLAKRFARIWPVYVVAFAAMWLLTRASDSPAFATTWSSVGQALAFLPRAPDQAAPFFGYPLLHVGWTLNYEAFFYLLFAISLFVPRRWRLAALAAMFAGCLIGLPLILTGDVHFDALTSYRVGGYACVVTSPIIWDFGFGVLIARIHRSRFTLRDRGVLACLVAITAGAVLWQLLSGYRMGHGPTRWGLPMAALVLALTLYNKRFPIAMPRPVVWLGDISFSLYLFHILPQMLPRLIKHQPQLMGGGGFFVACIVMGLVLAYLAHRWLERGLSEWVRQMLLRRISPPRRPAGSS
jgi:exopolysaccharide production protein ExoZ